jgi:hypothetical protein
MANYKSIVSKLQKHYSAVDNVIIIKGGKRVFNTKGFDISKDMKSVIATWQSGQGQSVSVSGIKYSILQCAPERFIATNRHKKGHLIGATTPDKSTYMLAHVKPKAKDWFHAAYPIVARAAAMIQDGSFEDSFTPKMELIRTTSSDTGGNLEASYTPQAHQIDPFLKAELEGFLQWINNPNGLQAYITQALQTNDPVLISKLSQLYQELYSICHD